MVTVYYIPGKRLAKNKTQILSARRPLSRETRIPFLLYSRDQNYKYTASTSSLEPTYKQNTRQIFKTTTGNLKVTPKKAPYHTASSERQKGGTPTNVIEYMTRICPNGLNTIQKDDMPLGSYHNFVYKPNYKSQE